MANERHVYVIGDYVQTNQEAKRLLENTLTASASIQSYELNRKQVLEKHRRVDLLSSTSLCVFTFPRQERYLIYDRDDPVNSYYNEIHTLNEEKVNLLILLFYNEETPENDLFHKNLDRMWRLGGAQAALKVFAETDRFFSIKANFNKTQEKQICKQLHIEAKSKGNKENPNDMKHELEVRTQGMWELEYVMEPQAMSKQSGQCRGVVSVFRKDRKKERGSPVESTATVAVIRLLPAEIPLKKAEYENQLQEVRKQEVENSKKKETLKQSYEAMKEKVDSKLDAVKQEEAKLCEKRLNLEEIVGKFEEIGKQLPGLVRPLAELADLINLHNKSK